MKSDRTEGLTVSKARESNGKEALRPNEFIRRAEAMGEIAKKRMEDNKDFLEKTKGYSREELKRYIGAPTYELSKQEKLFFSGILGKVRNEKNEGE